MNKELEKELDEILNDDLLQCKVVKSADNEYVRIALIKWTKLNLYSIATIDKSTKQAEESQCWSSESEARKEFDKFCDGHY